MQVTVIDHPLVAERVTRLRDETTTHAEFRRNLGEVTGFLVYEALRDQPVTTIEIDTPMSPAHGVRVTEPPLVVPVMRAGLGMLPAALTVVPDARVGFVGLRRDEQTFLPHAYVNTIPDDLGGRSVLVLDPMLATGGSLVHTCNLLRDAGAGCLRVVCVLSAPEGVRTFEAGGFEAGGFEARLFTAAIDDRLDERAFIVPGLGDAGDRQFGTG